MAMSRGLARNHWAIGLRGGVAVLFGLGVLLLPPWTIASLVLLFAGYVTADGIFAIVAGARAAGRGERWWTLIAEGLTNLLAAGAVLAWQVVEVAPFIHAASAWAVLTGALLLAAGRRLAGSHGRRLLMAAGGVSVLWGVLAATVGPSPADNVRSTEWWLGAYALLFGAILLLLSFCLNRRPAASGAPRTKPDRPNPPTGGAEC
jgi:uncharacterized membrane protein HdeD (DUF308 family)